MDSKRRYLPSFLNDDFIFFYFLSNQISLTNLLDMLGEEIEGTMMDEQGRLKGVSKHGDAPRPTEYEALRFSM